jgi:hypothetical protein
MHISRPLSVVIAACAAVALSAAAAPAAGPLGIGWAVHPRIDTGLYSGPGLSTPRIGTAWAGDNVAGICRINDNRGNRMVLGIERPGRDGSQWANTAGYIWDNHIRENTDSLPDCGTA